MLQKNGISLYKQFEKISVPKRGLTDTEELQKYLDQLSIPSLLNDNLNIQPPTGIEVTLSSDKTNVLSNDGIVIPGIKDELVSLKITAKKGSSTLQKTFSNLVVPQAGLSVRDLLESYLKNLTIPTKLTENLVIQPPTGVKLSLSSDDPGVLSSSGVIVRGDTTKNIVVTVQVEKDGVTAEKSFPEIEVPWTLEAELNQAVKDLSLSSLTDLKLPLNLPTEVNKLPITWTSSNTNAITNTGTIIPAVSSQAFTLTAWITKNGVLKK